MPGLQVADRRAGRVPHIIESAVFAKAPVADFRACRVGWRHVRLLSSSIDLNADYVTERGENQIPIINVITRDGDTIVHRWERTLRAR